MALLPVLLDMVDEIYENLDSPSKNAFAEIPLLFLPQRSEQQQGGCPRMNRRKCQRGEATTKNECPCPFKEQIKETQQAIPSECPKGKCPKSGKCQRNECPKEKEAGEKQREWNTLAFYDHPWARRHLSPFGLMKHCQQRRCPAKASDDFQLTLNVKSYKPEEITVKVKGREILIEGKHEEREDELGFVSRQFTRRHVLPDEFDIDSVSSHLTSDGKMIIKAAKPKPVGESGERIIPIEHVISSDEEVEKTGESSKSAEAEKDEKETSPNAFELIDDDEENQKE